MMPLPIMISSKIPCLWFAALAMKKGYLGYVVNRKRIRVCPVRRSHQGKEQQVMRRLMRCSTTAVALMSLMAVATAQQTIVVGPPIHVSKSEGDREHGEVVIAANPKDPTQLIAAAMVWNQEKSSMNIISYVSFDRGLTWKPGFEINEDSSSESDPAVAFGCDGTAYLSGLSGKLSLGGPRLQVETYLYRSTDGGSTWLKATVLGERDREYLIVDCSPSRFTGGLYMYAAGGLVLYSEDQGRTFREVRLQPWGGNRWLNIPGTAVVLSDGTLVVAYPELDLGGKKGSEQEEIPISAFRVTVGGRSFTGPFTITKAKGFPRFPNLAVDLSSDSFKDRIYAVWVDDTSVNSQIMFAYSTDKGETWSEPIVLNDDQIVADNGPALRDSIGEVAVNRNGVVAVTWYDRSNSHNKSEWNVRFTASFDGGESFLPSTKLSDGLFTHDFAKSPPFSVFLKGTDVKELSVNPYQFWSSGGDTAGLVSDADGIFHSLWVDRRTGIAQVWTSSIKVSGQACRNGDPELKDLEDITRYVTVRFRDLMYDPKTQKVSASTYLINTSDKTILGPVVIRLLGFRRGSFQILNSDNGQTGPGAVWNYASVIKDNRLESGQKSGIKRVEFRSIDVEEMLKPPFPRNPIIRARVLGKIGAS